VFGSAGFRTFGQVSKNQDGKKRTRHSLNAAAPDYQTKISGCGSVIQGGGFL
jgi:hypothetical protein